MLPASLGSRRVTLNTVGCACLVMSACGGADPDSAHDEFAARVAGPWSALLELGDETGRVYATDRYGFEDDRQTIDAVAYLDEGLTMPFLRYRAEFEIVAVERSPSIPDAYEIDARARSATMTALLDVSDVFAAFGLDDCGLLVGTDVDVSNSSCGVPFFADTSCVELDLFQVDPQGTALRVGVATGDKCMARPNVVQEMTYVRP